MGNSYQKFAKDVGIIGITNLFVGVHALILVPLLTKTVGVGDYGIWAQVYVTIQLVMHIVGLGLPFSLSRFLPAETDKEKLQDEFYSAFTIVALATLAASVLLILLANSIATAFFEGATAIVRITAPIVLVWSLDLMFLGLFRARRQMRSYAIFMLATRYGELALIAYLVLAGHGILSVVLAVLAIRAIVLIILFCLIKTQIGIRRPHFSRIKEYLNFGVPTIPGSISSWVVASSNRYVIGYFLGAASVGVYSAGYTLGNIPFMLAQVLGFVLPPTLSKLYDENRMEEVKMHLRYSLKYVLAIAIPFVFGAVILADPVLRLFSTAEIASEGYFVVPLAALGTLFFVGYVLTSQILILVKKTKIIGAIWISCALVNLGLNILLVPHLGVLGAAITTLIAYALALGLTTYYSFKEFKFPIDWRFIVKSLIASGAMSAAIWIIAPKGTLAIILTVIAGTAIYGAILLLLKGFTKEEFKFFRRLFQRG